MGKWGIHKYSLEKTDATRYTHPSYTVRAGICHQACCHQACCHQACCHQARCHQFSELSVAPTKLSDLKLDYKQTMRTKLKNTFISRFDYKLLVSASSKAAALMKPPYLMHFDRIRPEKLLCSLIDSKCVISTTMKFMLPPGICHQLLK